jgi:lipid-binding SYLF domain-containing protein
MQMSKRLMTVLAALTLLLPVAPAWADEYQDTINVFKNAVQSKNFFNNAYGYAVFPTIGKAGFIVGGAAGKGRVYEKGKYVGDTSVAQLSVGYQAGAEGYSQIIFFEDQRAFKEFTSGNFEFDANASATAITANAGATASTTGGSAQASGGKNDATAVGKYYKGMATFTVVKGGLMAAAVVAGQKYSYTPVGAKPKK